ncbi:uncharacterized protein A1O9_00495 [Exophiala aquamarina CBS 119918]|uniref:FAD/NAD(P)-binding domain-containing protein n=1 Tax=Exophiala aquamarina CBS 119918 TaxID=1182545 RepID=A0A072PRX8_9EURO|nr:uncharacterized protein A1O9_00495 [Exophiala aquamarina CBS 119918]KEF62522.1 hypothetical protein A1O9_00495 [Exophiala aquamarina CBS 119918]
MGSMSETLEYDAVLIGAGFGGYTMLPKLRNLGLRAKIFERGSGSGGVWHWNRYPGARVDSDSPAYQFFDKEIWEDFTFSERFPGFRELQKYFQHVERKWDLQKDIEYHKNVTYAHWDSDHRRWRVGCSDGTETICKWLFANVGFAAKEYVPHLKGAADFRGEMYHTAHWPHHDIDLNDKRIAVIGTGASGIQVIQEAGKVCKHLTVYQRTPNFCLPMQQRKLDPAEEQRKKDSGIYEAAFKACEKTDSGVPYGNNGRKTFDDTSEEREALWSGLIQDGGFKFWVAGYSDMIIDQKANDAAYDFWRRMVLKRIQDPKKARLLAPEIPPHPFGAKRPSLEQTYFEVLSQQNVDIIDLNEFSIEEINASGIRTAAGQVDVDLIVLATGFDGLTGGFMDIDLRGVDKRTLKQHWSDGVKTSMGVAVPGFPNMFFLFGPQAPSTFSNGPSCIQVQGQWFEKMLKKMLAEGVETMEAKEETAEGWCAKIRESWEATLLPQGKISTPRPKGGSFAHGIAQLVDWCQYSGQESTASQLGGGAAVIHADA